MEPDFSRKALDNVRGSVYTPDMRGLNMSRGFWFAAVAAVVGFVLAGCISDSDKDDSETPSSSSVSGIPASAPPVQLPGQTPPVFTGGGTGGGEPDSPAGRPGATVGPNSNAGQPQAGGQPQ